MMMSGSWRSSARTPRCEGHLDVVLHLHLIEGRFDHFDRIFDGADVHLVGGQLLSVEYRVVVLPDPVGPVTSTMPLG